MTETKRCVDCGETLPIHHFQRQQKRRWNRDGTTGISYYREKRCKSCRQRKQHRPATVKEWEPGEGMSDAERAFLCRLVPTGGMDGEAT